MDISLFTFNWFLTIFVDNIPVETYLRIWDTFLYEGNKVRVKQRINILVLDCLLDLMTVKVGPKPLVHPSDSGLLTSQTSLLEVESFTHRGLISANG